MNTQLSSFLAACQSVKHSEVNTCEYRLMYMYGAWVTAEVIIAESDKEAITDAQDAVKRLQGWKNGVALFCGNRLVHRFV